MTRAEAPDDSQALIGALLAIPNFELQRRVQAGFAAAGLPEIRPAHDAIFRWLPAEGGRVTDLAAEIGMTKQALGYHVAYLEAHGYLERVSDPRDRRALLVRRTEKGWRVNETARRLVEEVQDEWASHIGEERMDELRELLRDLVRHLGVRHSPRVGGVAADEPAGGP